MNITCPQCGASADSFARFCTSCGHEFAAAPEFARLRRQLESAKADADSLRTTLTRVSDELIALESEVGQRIYALESRTVGAQDEEKAEEVPTVASSSATNEAEPAKQQDTKESPASHPIQSAYLKSEAEKRQDSGASLLTELRFGQRWLLIVGLIITLLGIGYFLKFAFDRNWVGPEGRTAMAYLAALSFLIGGSRLKRNWEQFGLTMIGGGIAALYLSTYAAFEIYELIPQPVAFGLMTLTTALAGILAIVNDTRWLAILGIIGGFSTPILLSTGVDRQIALMSYMIILNLGILAIAFFKQWRLLLWLGFLFTWGLFCGWFGRHYQIEKFLPTLCFLNLFFMIYAVAPLAYLFRHKEKNIQSNITVMTLNTLIAFAYSFSMIKEYASLEAVAIPTVLYAALFLAIASFIQRRDKEQLELFVLFLSKAILFLIIAVPVLFSEHWITIFWSAQALVLIWAALRLQSTKIFVGASTLFAFALGKYLIYDYGEVFKLTRHFTFRPDYETMFVARIVSAIVVLGSLFAIIRMLKNAGSNKAIASAKKELTNVCWVIFTLLLFFVLDAETAGFFNDALPGATSAAISVLWTLFAITLILLGLSRQNKTLRIVAINLFAITIIKVLFVDMAQFSTPFRIVSFMVLGLVLIFVSYLYNRLGSRLQQDAQRKDDTP